MAYREVVRELSFEESARAVFGSAKRADDYLAIVEWRLAREPTLDDFPVIEVSARGVVRAMTTDESREMPAMVVLFTVGDGGRVLLLLVGHARPSDGN